ncbi:hypothetical protein [Pseudoramibacter alactolyticus]|uniref:hypothetical protein n=1 Tax=Pseudoramibacter alactolyticus TaxID=113287 RepID=UPI0023536437|nr:hypothetical protein [Pseudoramibacter alactolyticus]MBM6967491.1 hypothetical protein [Pseudoramibacter alactolyticus]
MTEDVRTLADIAARIDGLEFKKKWFGGVDERDVWKQLEALNRQYEQVFEIQRSGYEALLKEREALIRKLKAAKKA